MDIDKKGYWKPRVSNSPVLSVPKTSKAVAAHKKRKEYPHRLTYHLNYFLMGLPVMLYSLFPLSSTETLSMEFQI